jgi:hypothetical protein
MAAAPLPLAAVAAGKHPNVWTTSTGRAPGEKDVTDQLTALRELTLEA